MAADAVKAGAELAQGASAESAAEGRPSQVVHLPGATDGESDLGLTPHFQQSLQLGVKLYCGAKIAPARAGIDDAKNSASIPGGSISEVKVHGTPLPAWMDLGIASHMSSVVPMSVRGVGSQPLSGPVPEGAESATTEHLRPRFQKRICLFRFTIVLCAIAENVSCYAAYFEARAPEDNFYNKFEAHAMGMKGLDIAILAFALATTVHLFVSMSLLVVLGQDIYRALATVRLPFSAGCGILCMILLFYGETTKPAAFFSLLFVLLHFAAWLFHEHMIIMKNARKRGQVDAKKQLHYVVLGALVVDCIIVLVFFVMFVADAVVFLHESECPATRNTAMPVRVAGVRGWQCVKWGSPHYITREPDPARAVYEAYCSTSFHVFDTQDASTGAALPSSDVYSVRCPPGCQSLNIGTVVGCRLYDARSSICSAAVQMGALPSDIGGVVKVVGRPPTANNVYDRCNMNGVLSSMSGTFTDPNAEINTVVGWAFYFQVGTMRDLDMVTLHGWSKSAGLPDAREPWNSYTADASWVVGGSPHRQEVGLGPSAAADIEVNFCHKGETPGCTSS